MPKDIAKEIAGLAIETDFKLSKSYSEQHLKIYLAVFLAILLLIVLF